MQKWEYLLYRCDILNFQDSFWGREFSDVSKIWANQPNSDLDRIKELGKAGWELVSVTPVVTTRYGDGSSATGQILFSFKRPIE